MTNTTDNNSVVIETHKTLPEIRICDNCKFLTRKRGSLPSNRLCFNPEYSYRGLFELECSPEAKACELWEKK